MFVGCHFGFVMAHGIGNRYGNGHISVFGDGQYDGSFANGQCDAGSSDVSSHTGSLGIRRTTGTFAILLALRTGVSCWVRDLMDPELELTAARPPGGKATK